MEGAAILNSLYEMCEEKKVSEEKKHQNRIEFVATLQKILNDDCMGNLIELVSYKGRLTLYYLFKFFLQ